MKRISVIFGVMLLSLIVGIVCIPVALVEGIAVAPIWYIITGSSYFDEWNVSTMSMSVLEWVMRKLIYKSGL